MNIRYLILLAVILNAAHLFADKTAHVLMPAYNASSFISSTVESVMMQTYPSLKLVLFHDGSTDNTVEIVQELIKENPGLKDKIDITVSSVNLGVARVRKLLFARSKEINPDAYIFWLDADDQYTDESFVAKVMEQMEKTKAQICLYNFSVIFEDESQISNAAGLLKDRENYSKILDLICSMPEQSINPLQMNNPLAITSLGWVKCYSPEVTLSDPVNCPFEDFVYMAALLQVDKITALEASYQPIQYLRRSTSICGQRKRETFLEHIPAQLNRFFDVVLANSADTPQRDKKVRMAFEFVKGKFAQYKTLLMGIIEKNSHPDITQSVLEEYLIKENQFLKFAKEAI